MTSADPRLEFDRSNRLLFRVDPHGTAVPVKITPLEYRLVEHMFVRNRAGRGRPVVCRYDELVSAVWPARDPYDARRALAGLVLELRRKIEDDPSAPRFLTNRPGEGYALAVQAVSVVAPRSPFVVGPPVVEPSQFFGRTRELRRLFTLWMHRPLHSALLVGPPRSGKTSLLYHVRALPHTPVSALRPGQWPRAVHAGEVQTGAAAGSGSGLQAHRMAFVNFQDPRARRSEYVLREILRACDIASPEPCSEDDFIARIWSELDAPAVVLLDEADSGLRDPQLAGLWATLRSAASHHPRQLLAFVVACHAMPGADAGVSYGSPFMNIVGELLELGPLTAEEAEELVASSPQPFPADDVGWMIERSGRWPALLQMFCDARLSALDIDPASGSWKEHALLRAARLRHLMPA